LLRVLSTSNPAPLARFPDRDPRRFGALLDVEMGFAA
jgi:hypothetical protein